MEWHYAQDGSTKGPVSEEEIKELIESGSLKKNDMVWNESMDDWAPLKESELKSFLPATPRTPPPLKPRATNESSECFHKLDRMLVVILSSVTLGFFALGQIFMALGNSRVSISYDRYTGQYYNSSSGMLAFGGFLIILGCLVNIAFIVFWMRYHYACWKLIPARSARTTPGKAVGFMFIPGFNFYWCFISVFGLVKEINKRLESSGSNTRLGANIPLAFCICLAAFPLSGFIILCISTATPMGGAFANILFNSALFVLFLLFFLNLKKPVEEIAQTSSGE